MGDHHTGAKRRPSTARQWASNRITTPEDAQANAFAAAFMKMLVKLLHAAVMEKADPNRVVQRYLMAYRATPHRMTGKSPAELIFGHQIQTKLPRMLPKAQGRADEELRQTQEEERRQQKAYTDAKVKEMKVADEVMQMLPQKKTTTKPPLDVDPGQ